MRTGFVGREATVKAVEPVEAVRIPADGPQAVLLEHPKVAVGMLKSLVGRLREVQDRLDTLDRRRLVTRAATHRTPDTGRSGGGLVVAVPCHLFQHAPFDPVARHDRDPAGRNRPQGGRAPPPVEQHEQPAARRTLLDQILARLEPDRRRVGADHDG
jgi:hypothetical protein